MPRNYRGLIFFVISAAVVVAFILFSNRLVEDLTAQERMRMQIWADATKEVVNLGNENRPEGSEVDFLLGIIEGNNNIPVLLTDDAGNIIMHRNFDLPEATDSLMPLYISEANERFLRRRLEEMKKSPNVIDITIEPGNVQHLYYEDSRLLRSLNWYPYVQLALMGAFILVVYLAVSSSKRAEQNKVWVGLSKETAHQLGTPISSLMAWVEMLRSENTDEVVVEEMEKDVRRLEMIASRFSKIGSMPAMEREDLSELAERSGGYMRSRISKRVEFEIDMSPDALPVNMSAPLLEWVMENLIKNAVDAMEGSGSLVLKTFRGPNMAIAEITDSGKGIQRKNFKAVFKPGFTTKKRGWGLGLTLAKRIVEDYHNGRIYIKWSEVGKGTTFRIELPIYEG